MLLHRTLLLCMFFTGCLLAQTLKPEQAIDLMSHGYRENTSSEAPTFIFINNDELAVNLPTTPAKLIYYNLKSGNTTEREQSADLAPFLSTRDGRFIRFISHALVLNDAELHEIVRIDAPFAQRFGARSVRVSPGGTVVALPRDRDIMLLNAANFDLIDLLPSSEWMSIGDHAALVSEGS